MMYFYTKWAVNLSTFPCEFFCHILSEMKENNTFVLLCLLSFSISGLKVDMSSKLLHDYNFFLNIIMVGFALRSSVIH